MPGVEELEPEPRNVPQRPLKREAKRGGRAREKRRARDSDVSCAAQSLAMFISGEEDGSGGGGQYFILVSLIHSLNLPSTSTHPPTHSSSGTLAAIRLGVRKTSLLPACCFSVSHSLSCERPDLWANRKRCARVIAQLRSRWRRGASIRRLPDVTDIYKPPLLHPKKKTLIVWGVCRS